MPDSTHIAMTSFTDLVSAAQRLGVIEAVMLFVMFVLCGIVFYLLAMLRERERQYARILEQRETLQAKINISIVESLIATRDKAGDK